MKGIIAHFVQTFGVDNINWSAQMTILKRLLKTYTKEQITYAIDYYANRGVHIYSLGYLSKCMDKPMQEYMAMKNTASWSDDSGERNRRKFAENNQAGSRKEYYLDLFEESEQSD
jgi:hypothetical protein